MKSILQNDTTRCYLCGATGWLEDHHIYFGHPWRKISEKNGFKVKLCPCCHRICKEAAHNDRETDLKLKKECQIAYEALGHSREEFRNLIGRSYIDDK